LTRVLNFQEAVGCNLLAIGRCASWVAIFHDSTRTLDRLPARGSEKPKYGEIIERRKKIGNFSGQREKCEEPVRSFGIKFSMNTLFEGNKSLYQP